MSLEFRLSPGVSGDRSYYSDHSEGLKLSLGLNGRVEASRDFTWNISVESGCQVLNSGFVQVSLSLI